MVGASYNFYVISIFIEGYLYFGDRAHFGQEEAVVAAGWSTGEAGPLSRRHCRGTLSSPVNWVFLFEDCSFISFPFLSGI